MGWVGGIYIRGHDPGTARADDEARSLSAPLSWGRIQRDRHSPGTEIQLGSAHVSPSLVNWCAEEKKTTSSHGNPIHGPADAKFLNSILNGGSCFQVFPPPSPNPRSIDAALPVENLFPCLDPTSAQPFPSGFLFWFDG